MLQPKRARKPAMRYEPMVPEIDSEHSVDVTTRDEKNDPGPAEEPGKKCQSCDQMTHGKRANLGAFSLHSTSLSTHDRLDMLASVPAASDDAAAP